MMRTRRLSKCRLGDFFCQGWNRFCQVNSIPVAVNPNGGFNCYWQMPFRKSCKITIENLSPDDIDWVYYQIDYTLCDVPENSAYLHAQWRRSNPLPYQEVHTLLEGVSGAGQFVGVYLAWGVNSNGWWGEGEIKFYLDGDDDFPTICGTGTEDYFWRRLELRCGRRIHRLQHAISRSAASDPTRRALQQPAALRHVSLACAGSRALQ